MYCRQGRFSSARYMRAKCSAMGRPIIFSLKSSKWVCPTALGWPRKRSSSDLTVAAVRRQLVWKHDGLLLIGTAFRFIQHYTPNTTSGSARFDTRKDRPRLPEG